ncbi:hypothetical protein Q5E69_007825 [Acinetobacter baumannii]
MTEVKFVSMPASELAQVIEKACENAVTKVLAAQGDELLTISELQKGYPAYLGIYLTSFGRNIN